jgi:hypothetical protein
MSRKIEQKLFDHIDEKLKSNGAAQHAIETQDARSLVVYAAEALVGVREIGGNNKGPVVELIQETIGRTSREAWCMAFVQSCIAYVEKKISVPSRLFPSEHCLTVWENSPKAQRVKHHPKPGAIAIWKHGKSQNGHTGFVTEFMGKTFEAVEGNTEAGIVKGEVERDGGGVYLTKRNSLGTGSLKVVGFLKPF